jgi:hypothetical protein
MAGSGRGMAARVRDHRNELISFFANFFAGFVFAGMLTGFVWLCHALERYHPTGVSFAVRASASDGAGYLSARDENP